MLGQEWPLPTFDEMAIASPIGAVSPALDERRSSTPTTPLRFGTDTRRCHDASMSKIRTTVTIDEGALTAVRVRAARAGKGDSEAIEEALRRDLGLDLLERLWAKNDLAEDQAMALAIEAQHATRPGTR